MNRGPNCCCSSARLTRFRLSEVWRFPGCFDTNSQQILFPIYCLKFAYVKHPLEFLNKNPILTDRQESSPLRVRYGSTTPWPVTTSVFRYLMGSDDLLAMEPHFPSIDLWRPFFPTSVDSGAQLLSICPLFGPLISMTRASFIPRVSHFMDWRHIWRGLEVILWVKSVIFESRWVIIYYCGPRLQMLAKIKAHVTRWRWVFIRADKNSPILDLLDNFKKVSAPNPEHLTIRMGSYGASTRQIRDLQPVLFKEELRSYPP